MTRITFVDRAGETILVVTSNAVPRAGDYVSIEPAIWKVVLVTWSPVNPGAHPAHLRAVVMLDPVEA